MSNVLVQIPTALVAAFCFGLGSATIVPAAAAQDNVDRVHLTCGISGLDPIPATDMLTFRGSTAWANVGITRKLGGIGVDLGLVDPSHPEAPLQIIDARSAGGAGWQTSTGGASERLDQIIHYNQAAGNSAKNWGYESRYALGADVGMVQQDWLPLYSNDFKHPMRPDAPETLNSPCLNTSSMLGWGKASLVPSTVEAGAERVLRLNNTYSIRSFGNQDWKWYQVDQGMYLTVAAARIGSLRVYIAQSGRNLAGPIHPLLDKPVELQSQFRTILGTPDDWFLTTYPMTYAVLVYHVGGREIGVAVHAPDSKPFTGFLRVRRHLFCKEDADRCGNIQWHTSIAMTRFDPQSPTSFKAGTVTPYTVLYDIAAVPQLAAEGFRVRQ